MASLLGFLSRALLADQVRLLVEERAARLARRAARAGACLAIGGACLVVALAFAGLSATLLLGRLIPLPWAALAVCGMCLVLGGGLLFLGVAIARRRGAGRVATPGSGVPAVGELATTAGRALGDFLAAHRTETLLVAMLAGALVDRRGKR